eukprot:gene4442-6883_t
MARAKNQAKHAEENKGKRSDGKTLVSAKESDAEIMRKKQEAAAAKKLAQEEEKRVGGKVVVKQKGGF